MVKFTDYPSSLGEVSVCLCERREALGVTCALSLRYVDAHRHLWPEVAFSSSSSFGLVLLLVGPGGPGHKNIYAFNLHE